MEKGSVEWVEERNPTTRPWATLANPTCPTGRPPPDGKPGRLYLKSDHSGVNQDVTTNAIWRPAGTPTRTAREDVLPQVYTDHNRT